jgi:hypothetical protein
MKTLTLIAAIAATAITTALSEEKDDASRIYVNSEIGEKHLYISPGRDKTMPRNTRDMRIHRSERNKREFEVITDEFVTLSGRVQIRLEAKFGVQRKL